MDWISRPYSLEKVLPFVDKNIVKVITGIRRCGKSVVMELIREELLRRNIPIHAILSMNFESHADPRIQSRESVWEAIQNLATMEDKIYLFLDEIQELEGWEKLINSLLVDTNVDIYITGSNANLLSGELATYLAGRYVEIKMFPLSFSEINQYRKWQETELSLSQADAFLDYLKRGGFPFLYYYDLGESDTKQYLSDIFDSIALKDIVQRYKVRDVSLFKKILLYFIANIGNSFSVVSLSKYLKSQIRSVSTETIYNYIKYCKSANLLHFVSRNDLIGKSILTTQEKIYLTDHGLREAIYGNNQRDINQVLENIVYIELLRLGYTVTVGKVAGLEIDFVADRGGKRIYIQVAYLLATDDTIEREFSVFEQIPDNYPKYVLSLDEFDRSRNGIIHKNIRDFLLDTTI
jgi:uncharacterized protein